MNLHAVRAALLADARSDADEILAEADREAEERIERATREAAALVETARAEGARAAEERLTRRRGAAHRAAREIVLTAQQQVLDDLRDRACAAARDLSTAEDFPALLDGLRALAIAQLGDDAAIEVAPDGEPGLVATDGHRRVDYRLATLANRAVDELGEELTASWE